MGFRDPAGDRQAEPGAEPSTRRIELDEAIEDPRLIGRGNAWPFVADPNSYGAAVLADVHRHRAAERRVLDRVLEDVQNQAAKQILVAAKGDLRDRGRLNRDAALAREDVHRATTVRDDFVQIEIDRTQRIAAGIGASESEPGRSSFRRSRCT